MISRITALTQNLTKISQNKDFNNTLPVLLKILNKESKDHYSIKIGNLTQQTKSLKELQIGARYFANISKSSVGTTLISNLTPYPEKFGDLDLSPLRFTHASLKKFFDKDKLLEYKDFLTQQFLQAPNRNDFLFYGNTLLALQKNIYHFVVDENGQNKILQLKAKKGKQSLEFYALFPNLGSLSGLVYYDENQDLSLRLITHFHSVKRLLEKKIENLKGFHNVEILVQNDIPPLFVFDEHLLNIKG